MINYIKKPEKRLYYFIFMGIFLCAGFYGIMLGSCKQSFANPTPEVLIGPADKVEIVYFHRTHRCTACLFAEERIIYVLNTHYKNEMDNGKITLGIYDVTDKKSVEIRQKFGAYGSQLFVNRIKDGVDHIRYIEEIWTWECLDNEEIFDKTLMNVINNNLYGNGLNTVNN